MPDRSGASTGAEARRLIREGHWRVPTSSLAPGYVQANLIVIPTDAADEFEELCQRNPLPLPLLERLPVGSPAPRHVASDADLRTDLPRYRLYRDGDLMEETCSPLDRWPADGCGFLLGCSFTFDALLTAAGIPVRHREADRNVPMYCTNRPLASAGRFHGQIVVSLRPIPAEDVTRAQSLTEPLATAHGGPFHVGAPEALGIRDLSRPDFGDPPDMRSGDVPVFWACGVTAQQAAASAHLRYAIAHAPGHMFVTDLRISPPHPLSHDTRRTA